MKYFSRLNEYLAVKGTLAFGTMWTFYVFVVYGALGLIFPKHETGLLYWENWIELWALPLLMVGTNLLARSGIDRELSETKQMITDLHTKLDKLASGEKSTP